MSGHFSSHPAVLQSPACPAVAEVRSLSQGGYGYNYMGQTESPCREVWSVSSFSWSGQLRRVMGTYMEPWMPLLLPWGLISIKSWKKILTEQWYSFTATERKRPTIHLHGAERFRCSTFQAGWSLSGTEMISGHGGRTQCLSTTAALCITPSFVWFWLAVISQSI